MHTSFSWRRVGWLGDELRGAPEAGLGLPFVFVFVFAGVCVVPTGTCQKNRTQGDKMWEVQNKVKENDRKMDNSVREHDNRNEGKHDAKTIASRLLYVWHEKMGETNMNNSSTIAAATEQ